MAVMVERQLTLDSWQGSRPEVFFHGPHAFTVDRRQSWESCNVTSLWLTFASGALKVMHTGQMHVMNSTELYLRCLLAPWPNVDPCVKSHQLTVSIALCTSTFELKHCRLRSVQPSTFTECLCELCTCLCELWLLVIYWQAGFVDYYPHVILKLT